MHTETKYFIKQIFLLHEEEPQIGQIGMKI